MPKRTLTELQTPPESSSKLQAHGYGSKPETRSRDESMTDEMGEFEDAYEDELSSDEEVVVDGGAEEDQDGVPGIIRYH